MNKTVVTIQLHIKTNQTQKINKLSENHTQQSSSPLMHEIRKIINHRKYQHQTIINSHKS